MIYQITITMASQSEHKDDVDLAEEFLSVWKPVFDAFTAAATQRGLTATYSIAWDNTGRLTMNKQGTP